MTDPTSLNSQSSRQYQSPLFERPEIHHSPLIFSIPRPSPWSTLRTPPIVPERSTPSPWGAVLRFLAPWTNKSAQYREGDYYTSKIATHPAVETAKSDASNALKVACESDCNPKLSGTITNDLGKNSLLANIWDFATTMVGFGTFGLIGKDPYYGVVGSFASKSGWNTSNVNCAAGNATLNMNISNSMSAGSLTRYGYSSKDQTILSNDPFGANGPLGGLNQNWNWEETVKFEANEACLTKPTRALDVP